MWSLTTVDPAAPSWSLPTAPGRVAIGRAPKGAGLVVPAAYKAVSQEHGRFDVTANTLSFTDTSSRGSSLNGAVQLAKVPAAAPAVSTAALQSGDVLVLGGAEGEDNTLRLRVGWRPIVVQLSSSLKQADADNDSSGLGLQARAEAAAGAAGLRVTKGSDATHFVAADRAKPTLKLCDALLLGRHVVAVRWLEQMAEWVRGPVGAAPPLESGCAPSLEHQHTGGPVVAATGRRIGDAWYGADFTPDALRATAVCGDLCVLFEQKSRLAESLRSRGVDVIECIPDGEGAGNTEPELSKRSGRSGEQPSGVVISTLSRDKVRHPGAVKATRELGWAAISENDLLHALFSRQRLVDVVAECASVLTSSASSAAAGAGSRAGLSDRAGTYETGSAKRGNDAGQSRPPYCARGSEGIIHSEPSVHLDLVQGQGSEQQHQPQRMLARAENSLHSARSPGPMPAPLPALALRVGLAESGLGEGGGILPLQVSQAAVPEPTITGVSSSAAGRKRGREEVEPKPVRAPAPASPAPASGPAPVLATAPAAVPMPVSASVFAPAPAFSPALVCAGFKEKGKDSGGWIGAGPPAKRAASEVRRAAPASKVAPPAPRVQFEAESAAAAEAEADAEADAGMGPGFGHAHQHPISAVSDVAPRGPQPKRLLGGWLDLAPLRRERVKRESAARAAAAAAAAAAPAAGSGTAASSALLSASAPADLWFEDLGDGVHLRIACTMTTGAAAKAEAVAAAAKTLAAANEADRAELLPAADGGVGVGATVDAGTGVNAAAAPGKPAVAPVNAAAVSFADAEASAKASCSLREASAKRLADYYEPHVGLDLFSSGPLVVLSATPVPRGLGLDRYYSALPPDSAPGVGRAGAGIKCFRKVPPMTFVLPRGGKVYAKGGAVRAAALAANAVGLSDVNPALGADLQAQHDIDVSKEEHEEEMMVEAGAKVTFGKASSKLQNRLAADLLLAKARASSKLGLEQAPQKQQGSLDAFLRGVHPSPAPGLVAGPAAAPGAAAYACKASQSVATRREPTTVASRRPPQPASMSAASSSRQEPEEVVLVDDEEDDTAAGVAAAERAAEMRPPPPKGGGASGAGGGARGPSVAVRRR